MKKVLISILAILIAFSVAACGGGSSKPQVKGETITKGTYSVLLPDGWKLLEFNDGNDTIQMSRNNEKEMIQIKVTGSNVTEAEAKELFEVSLEISSEDGSIEMLKDVTIDGVNFLVAKSTLKGRTEKYTHLHGLKEGRQIFIGLLELDINDEAVKAVFDTIKFTITN